jgi:hypothetical protein
MTRKGIIATSYLAAYPHKPDEWNKQDNKRNRTYKECQEDQVQFRGRNSTNHAGNGRNSTTHQGGTTHKLSL